MRDRGFILLSLLICLSMSCSAQTIDQDDKETIRALVEEVKELKARVATLEAKQPSEEAVKRAVAPAVSSEPTPAATQSQTPNPETGGFNIPHGIQFQGFASVTYKASNANPSDLGSSNGFRPGSAGNFSISEGDVDLFLTSRLTNDMSVLGEITFSQSNSGEFTPDVERLLLKYSPDDYLKTSTGRFHTATSYYNETFHHGLWLQTTIDRPLVVEFSDHGGLIPSQAIGSSVTGKIPSGKLGLNYIVEYGTPNVSRPQVNTPDAAEIAFNNGNETTAGLFAKPDWLPGMEIGGSFYHDRISPAFADVPSGQHFGESIVSGHVVYVTPRFEFLNEGFLIQHKLETTGQRFNTPAFYSQISKKFGSYLRPYFRYQYANASTGSPLFPDISKRHGPSGGMRFDLNDYVALKIQFDHTYRFPLRDFSDVQTQFAFRF